MSFIRARIFYFFAIGVEKALEKFFFCSNSYLAGYLTNSKYNTNQKVFTLLKSSKKSYWEVERGGKCVDVYEWEVKYRSCWRYFFLIVLVFNVSLNETSNSFITIALSKDLWAFWDSIQSDTEYSNRQWRIDFTSCGWEFFKGPKLYPLRII